MFRADQITRARLALLGIITLAGALIKLVLTQGQEDEAFGWMDLVPWICLTLILLHTRLIRAPHKQASGLLAAALLGNALTFGLFNPVQSAVPIFSLNRDAIQQHLMETAGAQVSSEGTLIVPGRYGAVLAGVGLPTITHVLYYPQQAFFRKYFPDISSGAFDTLFNRFEHVSVRDNGPVSVSTTESEGGPDGHASGTSGNHASEAPFLAYVDHVEVPASAFLNQDTDIPQLKIASSPLPPVPAGTPSGHIDSIQIDDHGKISLQGWVHLPLDGATIRAWASVPIQHMTLIRQTRPDVAQAIDPALLRSGIRLEIHLAEGPETDVRPCLRADGLKGETSTITFPGEEPGCTLLR